jgi:hypothetical protein
MEGVSLNTTLQQASLICNQPFERDQLPKRYLEGDAFIKVRHNPNRYPLGHIQPFHKRTPPLRISPSISIGGNSMQSEHLPVIQSLLKGILPSLLRGQEAYLDPGSGSYLIQILIASLLGGLFVIRSSWDRIKGFFRRLLSREEETALDEE